MYLYVDLRDAFWSMWADELCKKAMKNFLGGPVYRQRYTVRLSYEDFHALSVLTQFLKFFISGLTFLHASTSAPKPTSRNHVNM